MFRGLPFLLLAFVVSAIAQGNSQCAQWCAANFPNPGAKCTSLAAKGTGPCYDCGPLSTNPAQKLCDKVCKDTSSDNANCGDCGHACNPSTEKCEGGTCVPNCAAGQTQCGTSCVDLSKDPNNCGECGKTCASGQCENGACVTPSCTGQTCQTFTTCGPGGSCVCGSTTGGTGFCVDGSTPCSGLADCNSNSDCASGEVCAIDSCCVRNVCVGASFCGGNTLKYLFMREVVGPTVGHPAVNE